MGLGVAGASISGAALTRGDCKLHMGATGGLPGPLLPCWTHPWGSQLCGRAWWQCTRSR